MPLAKSGQIGNVCQPNALMTLKEFLMDYASSDTKKKAEGLIERELEKIDRPEVRDLVEKRMAMIEEGKRDFRF